MAKAAQSKELKAAFLKHQKETAGQIKRLEGVFKIFGKKPTAKKCEAIMGITKEGAEIMTEYKGMPALDAGLAAAAQRWSTMRSPATARWRPGRRSLGCLKLFRFSMPR